jgi:multicomponent Na+:H+ antiporter subunit E
MWTYAGWIILTWTRTAEQLLFGALASAAVATALRPLGPVLEPWRLLDPRRLFFIVRIAVYVLIKMVRANLSLSRRIWSPTRPLRPGMVVVPTSAKGDGELTAVGLLTSLIVDNQIVDVDRSRSELQYHAVWVDSDDPVANRGKINGPLEQLLLRLRPGGVQ